MKKVFNVICVSLLLFLFPVQVSSSNQKAGSTVVENSYLTIPSEANQESGMIMPTGTISSSNLRITKTLTPYFTGGVVTRIAITVTWEWLTAPANYLEDTIAITWNSSLVDWRYDSSTIVRRFYSISSGDTSWTLRNTDYSVGNASANGYSYDQTLYTDLSGGHSHGTRNKGTISFSVNPVTTTIGKDPSFNLYTNYQHKVAAIGFQGSVYLSEVSSTGFPTFNFGFGVGYKYDNMVISAHCAY